VIDLGGLRVSNKSRFQAQDLTILIPLKKLTSIKTMKDFSIQKQVDLKKII